MVHGKWRWLGRLIKGRMCGRKKESHRRFPFVGHFNSCGTAHARQDTQRQPTEKYEHSRRPGSGLADPTIGSAWGRADCLQGRATPFRAPGAIVTCWSGIVCSAPSRKLSILTSSPLAGVASENHGRLEGVEWGAYHRAGVPIRPPTQQLGLILQQQRLPTSYRQLACRPGSSW